MPKEARYPKSELQPALRRMRSAGSDFWQWGDALNNVMILREGALSGRTPPSDLMERTARHGQAIVRFSKKIPRTTENIRLIDQLVGAGTSIGANYCEADDSVSGKDFKNEIRTCRKESKETMFFLRMVAASEETLKEEARELWREGKELNLIFGSIWRKR